MARCKIPTTEKGYPQVSDSKLNSSFGVDISLTLGLQSWESQPCHSLVHSSSVGPG